VHWALLWLAVTELRRAGLRSGLTAFALALAILTVSVLDQQSKIRQDTILQDYEAGGAGTFLAELRTAEQEIDPMAGAIGRLQGVTAVEAPYRGRDLRLIADTSFLVFQNDKQQEFLGATTAVLGVTASFDLVRDYYEVIGIQGEDSRTSFGIPLIVTDGLARTPSRDEVLVPAAVAEYVGVRRGAVASIELKSDAGQGEPVQRYPALKVIGVFDVIGPDEGRFAPFWRLAARGRDVLTLRRPDAQSEMRTTLPIVVNAELLRDLWEERQQSLRRRGVEPANEVNRRQLVIRAGTAVDVPAVQEAVERLLIGRGLSKNCPAIELGSFCLVLPERNNFAAALHEQTKFGTGAGFFAALLIALIAIGNAGLQLQAVISRWHDQAVLHALGFTPSQLLLCSFLRLGLIFGTAIAASAIVGTMMPSAFSSSFSAFATAAGLCSAASLLAATIALLWPLRSDPAEQIRRLT
jgi:hypothetical protein